MKILLCFIGTIIYLSGIPFYLFNNTWSREFKVYIAIQKCVWSSNTFADFYVKFERIDFSKIL